MNTVAYRQALDRLQAEYREMPGLRLTADQVRRLCGVDRAVSNAVLDDLLRAGFLCQGPDGGYARAMAGATARSAARGRTTLAPPTEH